jgi:Ca2+-transporting ATPase
LPDPKPKIDEPLFHTLDVPAALNLLQSNQSGLSEEEAQKRAFTYGKNELEAGKKKSLLALFFEQFKDIMIIILLIAALISGVTGEITDAIIILIVVILNAVLSVIQETKAEKALDALKKMSSPFARVKREGIIKEVKSEDLVPGDIVILEAGNLVPADLRLIESYSLQVEEAALTGESLPVDKTTEIIEKADLVIGDRTNMAYSSSNVTYGRALGVVTATGMNTEVGKIAGHLASVENQETPLQKKLKELSKYLTIGIIIISVAIFGVGILNGRDYLEMFLTAISLAVAAIPEGLPAVITIVLALGVQKMARRNAIVRKLSAVETLGSTQIICSDKTGTLTQNRMTVKEIYLENRHIPADELKEEDPGMVLFTRSIVLCNDSQFNHDEDASEPFLGDPTETALASFGLIKGFSKGELEEIFLRIGEIPFDSERKLMTTIHTFPDSKRVITKGAPDVLLGQCTHVFLNGKPEPLTEELQNNIQNANKAMAAKALRVLAVAFKEIDDIPAALTPEKVENNLVFLGLVGMIDPPREEAKEAVRVCIEAGIRPIMITGDHKDTATAIAKDLNIIKEEDEVITGIELNKLSDEEFKEKVQNYSVYARVSPEHKVRIVNAWKKHDKVVAMTGDGVNDAPALKASDIGIGMGITGTEVAKGASNIVLADDNFATIVVAVEEGRKVYNNMRRAIQFLLSSNLGEILTLFIGTMLGWIVLLPIHILWVNLITDTLPALALGVEKAEKDIMKQKPRKAKASFFSDKVGLNIIVQGMFKGLLTLLAFYLGYTLYSEEVAITMTFMTLGLIQLFHSLNVRSNTQSIFKLGLFTNPALIGAILIGGFLQVIVIFVPFLRELFKVEWLNLEQWAIVLAASLAIIPIVEIGKLVLNFIHRHEKEA